LTEQTLIIIKPDGVKRSLVGEVIKRFEIKGFKLINLKMFTFDKKTAEKFYYIHKSKHFFNDLVSFMTSGNVVAAIIEGNNAIETTRFLLGSTKSFEAKPGSIRGDYALGLIDNVIHASDSKKNFEVESQIIF
jgi:nucleoside-diphosphate kinase